MQKGIVAVIGLGYVGLPLAVLAKEKGWRVIGVDIDENKVNKINAGESPFEDDALESALKKFPIEATTDAAAVKEVNVIVVAVPTPVTDDKQPDLTPVISAISAIRPHLKAGQLLSIESTINPGVMDEVVIPLLKEQEGLRVDADGEENAVYLVHCPERINPGDTKWSVRNIPRVIGGYTEMGTGLGKEFYESVLEATVKQMGSAKEAEAVKIMENTFRDVNIAFVNEMAMSFDKLGIDIKNVIEGASTKPFAYLAHYPGNGVGGHCISVDPYYMIERGRQAGFDHQFLKLARSINNGMPEYSVTRLEEGLNKAGIELKEATVALLGLSYKKNIDDLRESPALEIRELLEKKVKDVRVFDPHVPQLSSVTSLEEALLGVDAIMLATDHNEFTAALTPEYIQSTEVKVIIDGKNALDADGISKAGITYLGIGRSR